VGWFSCAGTAAWYTTDHLNSAKALVRRLFRTGPRQDVVPTGFEPVLNVESGRGSSARHLEWKREPIHIRGQRSHVSTDPMRLMGGRSLNGRVTRSIQPAGCGIASSISAEESGTASSVRSMDGKALPEAPRRWSTGPESGSMANTAVSLRRGWPNNADDESGNVRNVGGLDCRRRPAATRVRHRRHQGCGVRW
jgi:hypothetical protein